MPIIIIAIIVINVSTLIRIIKLVMMEYVISVAKNIKRFITFVIITMMIMEYAYNALKIWVVRLNAQYVAMIWYNTVNDVDCIS